MPDESTPSAQIEHEAARVVSLKQLQADAYQILEELQATAVPVLITRHGQPVASLLRISEEQAGLLITQALQQELASRVVDPSPAQFTEEDIERWGQEAESDGGYTGEHLGPSVPGPPPGVKDLLTRQPVWEDEVDEDGVPSHATALVWMKEMRAARDEFRARRGKSQQVSE